ncbi:MAG: phosphatidylglycerophosphatase A [Ignavibacteriales bacterium]|nr:MAG: phosphatidylglycerophosphatase A [Ignavibacteriaceae bacterium]MBW7872424.1 phosphatidylglycerophosphatase A [Ignavibacteria bacterium]MCZ2143642.1 phosphatidylglycerophosphatase A [Ignavibacteriales bacterium]OQY74895.1 MAG: hypothetical protein B6D45_06190 [Ignavibacteriales bacterium UTCHB3]MBV6445428.1 Phosphatidylglycerophosphatase A [Ignavibacteriaceae bacterium]
MAGLNPIHKFLGSGFLTGYLPGPTGTYGSVVALLIYLIPGVENIYILLPLILVSSIYGIWVCGRFEQLYGKDPKEATIDEFVGMWITLVMVPKEPVFLIVAFLIWRFLDIVKPYPARNFENFSGGLGVMADDIMSGVYSLVIVHTGMALYKYWTGVV